MKTSYNTVRFPIYLFNRRTVTRTTVTITTKTAAVTAAIKPGSKTVDCSARVVWFSVRRTQIRIKWPMYDRIY